jgi:hypothetical protein
VQDIRLVCKSSDTSSVGCDHLFQNNGATNKLVRLPENCGKNAFARVAKAWVPKNQTIPSDVQSRLIRRDGESPTVHALSLDTNFAAIPADQGNVNIAIQGSTVPGQSGDAQIAPPARRSRLRSRGLFSFIEDAFDKFNSFDENVTKSLPPIDVAKDFPLLDASISCPASGAIPALSASAKADIETKAHAVIDIGAAAAGTIVPPKLSSFGLYAGLTAELDGKLKLTGSASGSVDSGAKTLFQVGIPGLDFPGILTIGPSFKINAQAKAGLDVGIDMVVDLNYQVKGAKLFFPSSANHASGGGFTPGDTPLKLSVSPDVTSKGTVEAHLIPTVCQICGSQFAQTLTDLD